MSGYPGLSIRVARHAPTSPRNLVLPLPDRQPVRGLCSTIVRLSYVIVDSSFEFGGSLTYSLDDTTARTHWSPWIQSRSPSPRSHRRGFRIISAIHFIDPRKHARLAGHRWWHMLQESVFPLRRRTSRVDAPAVVWVIWSCDGHDETSHVRDLSFGGLFVETPIPRAVGATAVLVFLVQEGQIRADAVVRHLKPGHGVGLEFRAMMDGDSRHRSALCNRLSRSS